MEHKIRIHRRKAIYGFGTPLCVRCGDEKEFKLLIGKEKLISLPDNPTQLIVEMYGNMIQLRKVRKECVIFPDYSKSGTIDCEITLKPDWLGCMTLGLLHPVSKIIVDVTY